MSFSKKWSIENIQAGFQRFEKEFGHLPTGPEVDKTDYLPSSRQIQRLFGGLPELRVLLGHKYINFSKGIHRSRIGVSANYRSRISESKLRDILYKKFHEPFVHVEKPIDPIRKIRADFYIFNPIENFSVDIFTTETSHDLSTNVGIKLNKYSHFQEKMYLVLLSEKLTAGDILLLLKRKKNKFPSNVQLVTLEDFINVIKTIPSYQNPTILKKKGMV